MRAFVLLFVCLACLAVYRADELAAVTGLVTDPHGRSVPGVTILITNLSTNVASRTVTNDQGIYRVPSLQPGIYRITIDKDGFKSIVKSGIELHVQDVASINFELQVGSVNETVTVEAGALVINTTDATVSTVVDRQFAENLPLNGRSFQTLIQLTPGVVLTPSSVNDPGQFSVNGQRASSNYWTVDGVSANIGVGASFSQGNGTAGALPGFSAQGGTNSLVSVDALQEFRIQTSTYAPEFGRTPGGQISIVTRSGANQFHGTVFDYFRNAALDANDWFADENGLPKPQERQNDFGGTFSGPILKDRTFFFFSYEGLRLQLPQVAETTVPSISARQSATASMQPFLNAYPLPNPNAPDTNGISPFNASYSNPSTLNATSLRIDHKFGDRFSMFGRYNYSPSELSQRGNSNTGLSVNTVTSSRIVTQTATAGATWSVSPMITNDVRFNFSRNDAKGQVTLDNFGGAVPLTASNLPFPGSFTSANSTFTMGIFTLAGGFLQVGRSAHNVQRQINIIDNVSIQKGSHSLKFGADYRRLTPSFGPPNYFQEAAFFDVAPAQSGNLGFGFLQTGLDVGVVLNNLGVFAQDSWRLRRRLTVTYGIRWDIDFTPSTSSGPSFPAVTNFNNLANLALAPAGVPPFKTTYGNVAPRFGIAYQLSDRPNMETIVRGGIGVFYDLATQEVGNLLNNGFYPFGATKFVVGGTFPLDAIAAAPPMVSPSQISSGGFLDALDPNLKLPYTLEWNVAIEQALGTKQSVSASYVGAAGRRLLESESISQPNPNISNVVLVGNNGSSDYDALQLQFQRRLSNGLQALASYTWAHSIDTGSASSTGSSTNIADRQLAVNANRGPSDFDIRNTVSAGMTYEIPAAKGNTIANSILGGWSLQNVFQARSATPSTIFVQGILFEGSLQAVRPDVVPGQPLYLFGSQFPGGKAFNPDAFTPPPVDPSTGAALRQGDLGRNALRAFGAWQWDFAVHRDFRIRESLNVQFRAEMFNVLNHPNFGSPGPVLGASLFGQSTQMLGSSLSQASQGAGGFSPLYQFGGPRSIQLALKLMF